jgi:hypothetical protein
MRSIRTAIIAMLVLAIVGLCGAQRAEAKGKYPGVHNLIVRTHKVVQAAWKAVKKGHEGKAAYRKAWIHQHAAGAALRNDKPALAAKLSLLARIEARKAIHANKGEEPKDVATDTAEETKAAEGATDAEVSTAVEAEEKTAPSEEEVLKEEPKPIEEEK